MEKKIKAILIGLLGGLAGGLVGIGGGIIMVPLMLYYLGFSQHAANATSLAAIVPISVIGASIYGFYGNMELTLAGLFAIGGIAGAYLGSALMPHVKPKILQRMLAIVVIAASIRMGFDL
ncbi:sulfite exporter TauE/SafE family protein [Pelosinus sp. IPA-1]|uniref:sulfite exporter TauE/SafE family protein n=1 Tax=Pelosinus sp. IPA-1 TaxID=3029569 RepID=UPI002436286E|nr:sulfite exporter TauE/SafE family protein [Pelosinus sp. IPA-1]GMA98533.1 hypothetical protein PIPA1_13330 [Pelosinus sp. IPA-1]